MDLTIARIAPEGVRAQLPALARLRIEVFRAFPYLYDGDLAYEERYLETLAASPNAVLVGAWDGERLVGAATGAPMEEHAEEFAAAFEGSGYALDKIFYCAESVLLPEYRGRGVGHGFFDEREAAARSLGRAHVAFCGVVRPDDHPMRPAGYRPLDGFWRKRGYAPLPGVIAEYAWRDLGDDAETKKPLQFWIRSL